MKFIIVKANVVVNLEHVSKLSHSMVAVDVHYLHIVFSNGSEMDISGEDAECLWNYVSRDADVSI